MKRIVILIDGTWNEEGIGNDTNLAKLDPGYGSTPFIKPTAANGTSQRTFYHKGVGVEPDWIKRILGGAIGVGLKKLVQDCYGLVVDNYEHGDEIYIFGFSRGAYAARALAGLIGASGIQRQRDTQGFETLWKHYRVKPAARNAPQSARGSDKKAIDNYAAMRAKNAVHEDRAIKCVGVWDTVGSYGVPAGFGFAALARYVSLILLGFQDTQFGHHIDVGLHALGIDEKRRPFVPTFWTIPKGHKPRGVVEQTWFAGVHCNVGGGYPDSGLSDVALIWMIARVQALTGLEFDVPIIKGKLKPDPTGEVYDSSKGWPVDQLLPHLRSVLSPDAIDHGYFFNSRNTREVHINERVHWSVLKKLGSRCTVAGVADTPYRPANLPADIPPAQVAEITPEEQAFL
jgi:T6SS, Phospholipase effector Tle1-like, catalytic domain